MADVRFEVVRVGLPTSGTVDATISGFGTPAAALFFTSNASANATIGSFGRLSIGFKQADGNEWCCSTNSNNGTALSDTRRGHSDARVSSILSGTSEFVGYSATRITNGYRISIAAGSTGVSRLCTVVLIGGADVADAYVGNLDLGTTTANQSTISPAFEPDLLFTLTANDSGAVPSDNANATLSFGVANNGASIEQASTALCDVDAQPTTVVNSFVSHNRAAAQVYNNALSWMMEIKSFDASGFTYATSASAFSDKLGYLALRFTNSPDVKVIGAEIPTSGNYAETGVGFTPTFGMLGLIEGPTATNTVTTANNMSNAFAVFDGSAIYTTNKSSDDGVITSVASSLSSDSLRVLDSDGSTTAVASSGYAFDSDGWDFTLTTNPASAIMGWGLAIGAGAGSGYTLALDSGSLTTTGGTSDLLVSRNLALSGGVFSSTGGDVTLRLGRSIDLAGGAFSLTGGEVGLLANRAVALGAGGFSLAGGDVNLLTARKLGLSSGSFNINGGDLGLVYVPSIGAYTLALDSGSFSITGQDLDVLNNKLIELGAGSFGVTGGDLGVVNGYILDIESGTFLLTGQTLDLDRTRAITLEQGDIIVTGGALQLQSSGDISSTIVMRHQNTEESFRLVDVESGELAINLTTGKMWTVDHLLNITTVGGLYDGKDLPKSDPQTSGAWWNDDGTLKVSNG